jgi:hypothetical protein
MDPSVPLVENADLRRWLLLKDEAITQAAAGAAGVAELKVLVAHCRAGEEWFEAAKVSQAMSMVSASSADRVTHGRAALEFLQQVVSATTQVQQLELDLRSSLGLRMDRKSGERKHNAGRMEELMKHNSLLRMDPLGLALTSVLPRLYALCGMHPAFWDAGQVATEETAQEGVCMNIRKAVPLFTKAAEESVGARKECIRLGYELILCAYLMPMRSTDVAVEVQQRCLEVKWGRDGSIFTAACMAYRFERHFDISQGLAGGFDFCMQHPVAQYVAEYCGDVQQMVLLFEKQLGAMQSFAKRGVPGMEIGLYWGVAASSFTGLELQALHPFGTRVVALLESFAEQCTDPSSCEEWYGSSDWSAFTTKYHDGSSSKDGLHHYFLKPTMILHLQAILSLSLASMNNSDFDLSWLESLPNADDSKLDDCMNSAQRFTNTRVMIAEVLEWQGRHEEAVRSVSVSYHNIHARSHISTCSNHSLTLLSNRSFAQAEIQDSFNVNAASKVRAGRVLGRCHVVLGQHTLSVSAFDAAISLAKRGRFLLSEALTVRGRARAWQGKGCSSDNDVGGSELHWDERTGKQRLEEVMGRMQGAREPLQLLLGL